jgi:GNAT superfamily N-acetyltransferase
MTRQALEDGYELDDDPGRVDVDVATAFLAEESYWAQGRPRAVMAQLVAEAERVVGLYAPGGAMVGFCRVVSDRTTMAWLADVFVLEPHRGGGRGTAMVTFAVEGSDWPGARWLLATKDAHRLYEKLGFAAPGPSAMERPRRR